MLNVKINNNIKFPKLDLSNELSYIAKTIIIEGLKDGIRESVDIEGSKFPDLAASTLKRKKKKHTLIEDGLLIDSFKKYGSGNKLQIRIKAGRRKIAGYLQVDGVGKKKKKFNFFGVTDAMESAANKYMQECIKGLISG